MDREKEFNDHDLLIRIDERTERLEIGFGNHLKHHWAITVALIIFVLGLVAKIMWL